MNFFSHQERQLKIDEYREIAVPLVAWLQENIMAMSQRNFPTTLIEMKVSLQQNIHSFHILLQGSVDYNSIFCFMSKGVI